MVENRWSRIALSLCAVAVLTLSPSLAKADIFSLWIAGKGNTFSGSGDVFQNFDNRFGGGVEAGIEVFGIDLFGEAISMGLDQYLFTANLGFDVSLGDDVKLTLGVFTGPLFFLFPESEDVGALDFSALSDEERLLIEEEFGSLDEAEAKFNEFSEAEQDLSRLAVGWNLARARVDLDVKLVPGVYLGLTGQAGYHLLLSGQEIASGAKNEALENFASENNLPDEAVEALREVIGAEPIDEDQLDGFNFEGQVHLKIEFGT
jgi:hypothetical protein